jgi:RimJ/RimL family protein N-acetyltransferase
MGIRLRRTTEADLDFVLAVEHAPDNRSSINPWTREQHVQALSNDDLAHFIIETDTDGQPIGYIILAGLAQGHQSIEFRRIVITAKGQGYGKAALRLVKTLAFEEWQAHRLWLDVKEHNARARHVYAAEGFIVEGLLRECLKTEDHFESLVIMSMLSREYEKSKKA